MIDEKSIIYKSCRSTIYIEELVKENEEFNIMEKELIDLYIDVCIINNINPSFSRTKEDIKCLDNCTGVYVVKNESYISVVSTGNINQSLKNIDKEFKKLDIYLTVDSFDATILKHWLTKIYRHRGPVYIKWLADSYEGRFSIKEHKIIGICLYPVDIMKNMPIPYIELFSRHTGTYVLKDNSNIVYVGSTGDFDTRSNQHMSDKYFTNLDIYITEDNFYALMLEYWLMKELGPTLENRERNIFSKMNIKEIMSYLISRECTKQSDIFKYI